MSAPLLVVKNVVAAYGSIVALKGVDLEVREGEIVAMIGANGAGKSTLMMSICGMPQPREGSILFAGQEISRMPTHEIIGLGIGQAPEGRRIFARMTVIENLKMGSAANPKADFERDLARVFKLFPRLEERRDQRGGTLSGGEQQMLSVARALMSRPKLLLMDEPSLGLAPLVVEEIFRIITELHRDGTTIFLVEQNAHMALKVAHHFYLMEQGKVTFSGDPGSLAEDEVIRRAYLGTVKA